MSKFIYLIPLFALIFVGCFSIPQESIEIDRYTIKTLASFEPAHTTIGLSLKIAPFTADAIYRGSRIIYFNRFNQTDYYYYHRWIAPPEHILEDLLARNLFEWGLFGNGVFQTESGVMPTHEIRCRLIGLYAVNNRDDSQAKLEIKMQVIEIAKDTYEHNVIFQKRYSLTEERENENVSSFIEAVNRLADRWLAEVRGDLNGLFVGEPK